MEQGTAHHLYLQHQNLDALYAHFRESVRQEAVTVKAPN